MPPTSHNNQPRKVHGRPALDYRIRKGWRENQWFIIGIIGVVGIGLGAWGYIRALGDTATIFDCLYYTVKLFKLDMQSQITDVPWQLEIARFVLPALTVYTVAIALINVFKEQAEILRIKMLRDHIVVCGLGKKGLQLVEDLVQEGEKVVVVELDGGNGWIATCNDLGVSVVVGDATSEPVLKKANLKHAKALVALCSQDSTNADIALLADTLMNSGQGQSGEVKKIYVHIKNKRFCDILEQSRKQDSSGKGATLQFFNVSELGAKMLLTQFPPDRYSKIEPPENETRILIFGFGNLGESVVVQAVKSGHYLDGRLKVIVADEDARSKGEIFNDRYPRLKDIKDVSVEFMDVKIDDSGFFDSQRFWQQLKKRPDVVYVCLDEDSRNITCAFHLKKIPQLFDVITIVSIARDEGFALALRSRVNELLERNKVHIYPSIQAACTKEIVLAERLDAIARSIHGLSLKERSKRATEYQKELETGVENFKEYMGTAKRQQQITKNESQAPWVQLKEVYRDSNRQQAEHIPIKLRAIGCEMVTEAELKALGKKVQVVKDIRDPNDKLAKMEHNRWNAERFMGGWSYGKVKGDMVSPYLVDYEELAPEIKQYDRDAVLRIPQVLLLARPKYYIVKKTE